MKKLTALLLAMLMLLAVPFAYAEEAEGETEAPFEGEWVDFDDFVIYLPTSFTEYELTDEMADMGIFYVLTDEDQSHTIQFAYTEMEKDASVEELVAGFQAAYGEENVFTLESADKTIIGYVDAERDATYFVVKDPVALGAYIFGFGPSSDGDFMETAGVILGTMTFADAEAEDAE